jgi:hypothetical protein
MTPQFVGNEGCVIENCNTGFATIRNATNVTVRETIFRDNKVASGIALSEADGVTISGCTLERNVPWEFEPQGRLIEVNASTNVVIENPTFTQNALQFDLEEEANIRLYGIGFAQPVLKPRTRTSRVGRLRGWLHGISR